MAKAALNMMTKSIAETFVSFDIFATAVGIHSQPSPLNFFDDCKTLGG